MLEVTTLQDQKKEQQKLLWTRKKKFTLMELFDLGQELMERTWVVNGRKINLRLKDWGFGFNNRKSTLGICDLRNRRIELSKAWMEINTTLPLDMEDVVRHEIAHALDYCLRGTSDHSIHWKRICVQVGANPERLYDNPEAEQPKGKYTLKCPKCGVETAMHRKPKRNKSCGPCGDGRYNPDLKLEVIQNW
jgi:predicted SprT family Zn-dependent metalloprotease